MTTIEALDSYEPTLRSAFQSMKSEFSPLAKLQFLLQTALLFILVHNKASVHKQYGKLTCFLMQPVKPSGTLRYSQVFDCQGSISAFVDLLLLFIYAMACYGDATVIVHLAYVRHLLPHSLRSGAVSYIFNLFETCSQAIDRLTRVPSTLNHRTVSPTEL